jgi:hypothetical protein
MRHHRLMPARIGLLIGAVLALAGVLAVANAAPPARAAAAQQDAAALAVQKAQVMAFIFALDVSGFHELDEELALEKLGPSDLAGAVEPAYRTRITARATDWPESFRWRALELIDELGLLEAALRAGDSHRARAPGRAVHIIWHDLQEKIYGWLGEDRVRSSGGASVPQAIQAAQVIAVVQMLQLRDWERVEKSLADGKVIPGTLGAVRQSRSPVLATNWPEPLRAKARELADALGELERPVRDEDARKAVGPARKVRQAERELSELAYGWLGGVPSSPEAAEPPSQAAQTAQVLATSFMLSFSGFEQLDDSLARGTLPPGALRTASQARIAVLATTWPEPAGVTASELALALADLEGALRAEDVGRAAPASRTVREAWTALADQIHAWLDG